MSLRDVEIKKEYRSLLDNVAKEFYIPLLSEAVSYKRAVGFFSSTVLVEISKGITGLVKNGGRIQLVASPYLSDEDIKAIKNGYCRRDIVKGAILREMKEPETLFQSDRLNLLANLIADGILDIKIALTESENQIGMYHEKMGIIEDSEGNKVAFSGSMNESANALLANYETIDVYTSWSNENDRIQNKECSFSSIWNNVEPNINTLEFGEISDEFISKYKRTTVEYASLPKHEDASNYEKTSSFFKVPKHITLKDYQVEAISRWKEFDYHGIFDMATGTGKTYTALGALSMLSKELDSFAVVIVCPYQHLVEQWVEDIELFNVNPIIAYSNYPKWKELFSDSINAYKAGVLKNFCVVTTNGTFSTETFQKQLSRIKKNLCFIVDEAHNFGAQKIVNMLPHNSEYRLALSATIERFRDEEGTARLVDFFGEKCISFSLEDAINKGYLTSYYYYPVVVYLTEDELDEYKNISKKITKLGGGSPENCERNPTIELLLLKRARLVAGAKNKVTKLLDIIQPYAKDNHMLVYCGATKYDRTDIEDGDEIKQIDAICQLLYATYNMKVRKFTSLEDKKERIEIKETFRKGDDLQVVAAIKCLDEGVNIPAIKRAFILASSTNPKEYIQRRGRVLRRFEGKEYSEIFDFITLPRKLDLVEFCDPKDLISELSLLKKEFDRMMDFAKSARNPLVVDQLKEDILRTYGAYNINWEDTTND